MKKIKHLGRDSSYLHCTMCYMIWPLDGTSVPIKVDTSNSVAKCFTIIYIFFKYIYVHIVATIRPEFLNRQRRRNSKRRREQEEEQLTCRWRGHVTPSVANTVKRSSGTLPCFEAAHRRSAPLVPLSFPFRPSSLVRHAATERPVSKTSMRHSVLPAR